MSDLTKLTAAEFCLQIDNCDLDADEHTEVRRRIKRLEQCEAALAMLYDKWENGDPCYEDVETSSGYLGNAFRLSDDEEKEILALIPAARAALEGK